MVTALNSIKYNPQSFSFKGFNDETYHVKSENKFDWALHQTAFFRDLDTLEFVKNHLEKEFPQGTNIADFACSNGEETFSLMMLMKENNKDKKYKFFGYDLSPKVLEVAKTAPHEVRYAREEAFIEKAYLDPSKNRLRELFFECFETVPSVMFNQLQDINLLKKEIKNEKSSQRLMKLNCFKYMSAHRGEFWPGKTYMPKFEFVDEVVKFKQGDIHNIEKILKKDGKTGVIIFKNAWYHIHGNWGIFDFDVTKRPQVEHIIKSAYKILPKNGLFVTGNLKNDHVCDHARKKYIYQDGKRIRIYERTELEYLMEKNGFMPIFYQKLEALNANYREDDLEMYLPSVWKKV